MESTSREHKVTNHQPLDPATDEASQVTIPATRSECANPVEAALWRALREARRERDEARRKVCWLLRSWVKTEKDVAVEHGWDCFKNSPLDSLAKLDEECGLQ
jgi:hypothetical protein